MSEFSTSHPEVKSISIQMDNGNFSGVGKISSIPKTLPCERGAGSGCDGAGFDLWHFLDARIKERQETGHIFHCCQGRQKMGRTGYRQCLAELHGTFWIEYKPVH
jgi:hypothetical protein